MVEELQKDPSKLKLGGERREMTFMFMDICNVHSYHLKFIRIEMTPKD